MAPTALSSSLSEYKDVNEAMSISASPALRLPFTSLPQQCSERDFLILWICQNNERSLFVRPAKSQSFAVDLVVKNDLQMFGHEPFSLE